MELARSFSAKAELSELEKIAEGIECDVYKATSKEHGIVALKVPKFRVYQNVNDPNIEARSLLQQELRIYELLQDGPVGVPKPLRFMEIGDYPAMLCEYIDSDGSEAPPGEYGRIAALIHATPLPLEWDTQLVAHEGRDVLQTMVRRVIRRFGEFVKHEPGAVDYVPQESILTQIVEQLRRFPPCLLHMDFRDVNVRVRGGKIKGVIDWSNALIGPAAIDVFRTVELEKPGPAFIQAYESIAPFPKPRAEEELLLRLDAALMLALVFISEAPDPEARVGSVRRVEELARALQR